MYQQASLLDCCHHKGFQFIRGDVRDSRLLKEHLVKSDAIIALAAWVGAPLCARDPHSSNAINLESIREIISNISPNQKLLYPCTNSGYGIGAADIHCTEETPLNPISLYGKQKVGAEELVRNAGGVSFRLATVFGISPRMRLDLLVNDFVYRAVNDGFIVLFEPHFKRNYVHVRDVAKAFTFGLENYSSMQGQAYNVGLSSANLSKEELCFSIQKHIPKFTYLISPVGEDPDKRNYIISNAKIEKIGYSTSVDLDAGVTELIKGFQIIKRNQYSNI
jgi:nucleoside-diphosphate-sugar epimerase